VGEGQGEGEMNLTKTHQKGGVMEEKNDFEEIRVGEKVKTLRESKGLSLKELADLTGFSTALLSQMENHLVSPSLGTIIKLANALGVKVGDFLGETQGEPFTDSPQRRG
jgi:transcriptional regulator with XRE-family HTH domain